MHICLCIHMGVIIHLCECISLCVCVFVSGWPLTVKTGESGKSQGKHFDEKGKNQGNS